MLNAHLQAFNNAFEHQLQCIAKAISDNLVAEIFIARQPSREGIDYESHKLALNHGFNKDEFETNAKNILKEFGQAFLNNVRNGLDYADSQKSAFEYMMESFKTTSVNSLSLNDLMVVGKHFIADERVEGKAANIAQRNEMNRNFNNSAEMSAELRVLLNR